MRHTWERGGKLQLEVKNITVNYGQVRAIEDVSFSVKPGEIVAMIGPNGAGKSTALNAVFGRLELKAGDILFNDESIKRLRPDQHVAIGISLVPEGRRLFSSMSVIENLEMGAFQRKNSLAKAEIENVFDLFPSLKDKRNEKVGVLSTGEQQLLAMGRALMQQPKLLLADEPSLGLSPAYVDIIFEKLIEINKMGTSVLLVEQNAHMALEIAHRGYVFKVGSIFMEDTGENLLKSAEVKRAFLGGNIENIGDRIDKDVLDAIGNVTFTEIENKTGPSVRNSAGKGTEPLRNLSDSFEAISEDVKKEIEKMNDNDHH